MTININIDSRCVIIKLILARTRKCNQTSDKYLSARFTGAAGFTLCSESVLALIFFTEYLKKSNLATAQQARRRHRKRNA